MSRTLSRRKFIGATAGVAAAASLGGATAALGRRDKGGKPTVPPDLLGIQQFSIRDAITRLGYTNNPTPLMGFLGGPSYPADPTDLGPLVPLPGGFVEVFEFLASCGIKGFEFTGQTQNVGTLGRQPTAAEIRGYLDNAGLYAQGTHQFGGANFDLATNTLTPGGQALLTTMQTLGASVVGFSGNLSSLGTLADSGATLGFARAAERINKLGALLAAEGITYYYHPEQDNYRYFTDPAHPELDTVHRIQWVLANTDRNLFKLQLDYLHNYSGRARFRNPSTGLMDISVWNMIAADPKRLIGIHMKDGFANTSWTVGAPGTGAGETGGSPYNQTFNRSATFVDAIISGEGDLGKPYGPTGTQFDPDSRGFKYLIENLKGRYQNTSIDDLGRRVIIESDSGPGPTTGAAADPGRSLRHAKYSAKVALGWRE